MENNWLNLMNLFKYFNIYRDSIPLDKQKKVMNQLKKDLLKLTTQRI